MRAIMMPYCDISAADQKFAADRMGIIAFIADGCDSVKKDVAMNGTPDLVVMDFSWLQILPYAQHAGLDALADIPHVMIHHPFNSADFSAYNRGGPLNVIAVIPPEDTHAPVVETPHLNRLMMVLDAFQRLKTAMPEDTTIDARLFAPLIQRIMRTPGAGRAGLRCVA